MSSLLNALILFVIISIAHSFHVNIFHKSRTNINTAIKGTMIELEQYEGSFEKEVITCSNPVLGMYLLYKLIACIILLLSTILTRSYLSYTCMCGL